MSKSKLIATAVAFLAGLSIARGAQKPNIVYFIIDELAYYELSLMGNPAMQTPNVDRLAKEGIRFTQCLAGGPVCAPTRCALMTGKHAGHMSVRANGGADSIRAEEETIASMLKRAGYATGGFGKWGIGTRGSDGVPEKHGFDEFFGYYDQVHAHTYFPRYLIRNSQEIPLAGNTGDPQVGQTYSHYQIFEEAKKFIRENKDHPFFAYMPFTPPHGICVMPKDDPSWQIYKDKPWKQGLPAAEATKTYAAMVNMIDRQVGEIRDLLRELGVADNTIIFFSGDNGGAKYFPDKDHPDGFFGPNTNPKSGVKFRGFKGDLYEGGLRVPFIAHWPGKFAGDRVSDHLCYFPDMMRTIADLAGADCPKEPDGISIAPTLTGTGEQKKHEYLYWEMGKQTAVRMGDWKAVHVGGDAKPWELYDLSKDISETTDVADKHPDVLAKMKTFAAEAHTPMVMGEIHDKDIAEKDRNYLGAEAKQPAKKKAGQKAAP